MTSHRSGQSYKYSIAGKRAKDALNKDEQELFELCCLAGVEMSPAVYRIIMNLLKMNVSPIAITQMLKAMVNPKGLDPTPTPSMMTARSSASSSDIPGTGTGTYPGHSLVKRSASHSAVSGGSSTSTSRSSKGQGGSRSATSLQSDSTGRSRSTKTSSNTRT